MSKYLFGIYGRQEFKPLDKPALIFFGRSNVGKSSLINYILNGNFAKTSQTPGKTIAIHLFEYNPYYLIDLPGYGYSKAGITTTNNFSSLINDYLDYLITAQHQLLVCLLIDFKVGFQKKDYEALSFIKQHNLPFIICFTKSDKTNQSQKAQSLKQLRELNINNYAVTSAEKKIGLEQFRSQIQLAMQKILKGDKNE